MSMFDDLAAKAGEFIKDNPDKVEGISDQILEKAADAAESATGGKFDSVIEGIQAKADDAIGE